MKKSRLFKVLTAGVVGLFCLAGLSNAHAGYTETRYPIVLVHGLSGFDSLAGVYDYWYRIPQALERDGAEVYVVQVSAANSTELRGEQLLAQVEQIVAISGAQKVNLFGHSHGALTARYVAGVRPDLVASVTSIGGPNQGSKVADALDGTGSFTQSVLSSIADGFFGLIDLISGGGGNPQDSMAALKSLTTAGTADFNQRFPAGVPSTYCGTGQTWVNGVAYTSWGGVRRFTNALDVSDPLLGATGLAFGFEANDGLVSRCSSRLGFVVNDSYRLNHLDLVNQIFGLSNFWETRPTTIYRRHANRLKNAGL